MKLKQLVILTLATLCCSATFAGKTVSYKDSIQSGETYLFIDQLLTEEGPYSRTIPAAGGGDSTINLTLKFFTPCQDVAVTVADSIFLGDSYLFIDTLITPIDLNPVVVTRTIPRVAGCDSTITLTLNVMNPCQDTIVAYTDSIFVGESYLFIDTLITRSTADTTNYQRIIPRVAGCDSTINLTLIAMRVPVKDTIYDTTAVNRCYKEAFTDRLGVTYYPTQDTVVLDTLPAARTYTTDSTVVTVDSIYRYELKVWPAMTTTEQTDSLNANYGSFTWHLGSRDSIITDFTIDAINHREYMYQNIRGCDSAKFVLDVTVWPAMTTTIQTDSLNANYGSFTWHLGSRDSIITDFTIDAINHREYMYKNILGGDSAKFVLDVTVWPAMTTTIQTDSICATYGSFTWHLGSRDSIITDFTIDAINNREYIYPNILGGDSAKFVLAVTVWPATKYPTAKKDTIDADKLPYIWKVYEGRQLSISAAGEHFDTVKNILRCDSIIYELDLEVRRLVRREAPLVEELVCAGTEYVGRLTNHTINGLTEWQDSLRVWDDVNLMAIDSIYTYKIDTLVTTVPNTEMVGIKAYCDYEVDFAEPMANVTNYIETNAAFANVISTTWEVETKAGWKPAATTIITSDDQTVRVRVTIETECETTTAISEPYEVKTATGDDKPELNIPSAKKYGNRIVMVDRNATEALGWTIAEEDVTWYEVVGDADDRSYDADPALWNDKVVKVGSYYYTLADGQPLEGLYYALIPGMKSAMTCGTELRTEVLDCKPTSKAAVRLTPNMVAPNQTMELIGLDANESYSVRVIGTNGQTEKAFTVEAKETVSLKAATISGMYLVNVMNESENVSLKYIVK